MIKIVYVYLEEAIVDGRDGKVGGGPSWSMMSNPDKDFHNYINPIYAKYVYAPFFYVSTTLSIPSLPKETKQRGWKSSHKQTLYCLQFHSQNSLPFQWEAEEL